MAVSVPADACPSAGLAGLGVLSAEISPGVAGEVIELAGCREKRRRLLPAQAVVYFVLGLCLFSGADSAAPPGYRSVMRWLTNGVRHLHGLALPTSPALTRARQRLGAKPLELLFDLRRGALASTTTPGAFAFGLVLVAWDGTGLDAADTPANAEAFGVTQGGNPQLRLLALTECGTHALIDAVFDGVEKASEQVLARRLAGSLAPGMLLLADRNFPGHELWGLAAATGADLVWRIKKNLVFPPVRVLPDGSFHSVMRTPAQNVRHGLARAAGRVPAGPADGHLVRIIEYAVTAEDSGGGTRTEPFRLATTLLDHEQAPAAQVAALYHQRWEIENSYGELKTRLRGHRSSCAPDPRNWSARTAGIDPDRISFTVTVRIARDHASSQAGITPAGSSRARSQAIRDILGDLLPPRRNRQCERVKKPPKNTFAAKKRDGIYPPGRVKYKIKVTRKASLPAGTP